MLRALPYEFSTPDVPRSWSNQCLFGCREVEMTWRSHQKGAFHLQEERRQLNIDNWSAVCHGDWRTVRDTEDWKLLEIAIVMLHPTSDFSNPFISHWWLIFFPDTTKEKIFLVHLSLVQFWRVLLKRSDNTDFFAILTYYQADILFFNQNFYSAARRGGLGPAIRRSLLYG